MKYKGAAIQYDCHFMDKEKNLAALTNLVRQAAAQGAKLIVLPEMQDFLSWMERDCTIQRFL